jgi:signal transduction histidine kinase
MDFDLLRKHASFAVTRIQLGLDTLPAYQTKNWVELSLKKERERSSRLLSFVLYGILTGVVIFVGTITCSFWWISMPVRSIAQGCTRIANGDTRHRLPPVSRWQDEFSDVVAGVNCVADRFQQSEDDLLYKVKERSEQLVRSQKLANVGFLAAGVAHEINNPLSAISMAAESLEFRLYDLIGLKTEDAREAMDRVAMIRRESRRCGDITARLLDFSRSDKSGRTLVDVAQLVREVLAIVDHLGQYQDRTVEFDCHCSVMAEVDAAQIKQVILNLIANALQATDPGGVVRIVLQEQVDNLVLAITDNGCGMDAETLQHVFDPFYTTREIGKGTGLGLSITHRIVEDHGGTVTPMSDGPGSGSTFQIRLPRRQAQANAA